MKLLTKQIREQLLRNGRIQDELAGKGQPEADFLPVVKFFTPDSSCTWLLTELDPHDDDLGFGLADLGFGSPELGSLRISELQSVRGPLGLPVERELYFTPVHTLSVYTEAARTAGSITECPKALDLAEAATLEGDAA